MASNVTKHGPESDTDSMAEYGEGETGKRGWTFDLTKSMAYFVFPKVFNL